MQTYKNNDFHRWAKSEKLNDESLSKAVEEMENGLIDANLGGNVYKKRVALKDKGKRGGYRTILAYKNTEIAVFVYGFSKKEKANISATELKALKALAKKYLNYSAKELTKATQVNTLIEVMK